MLKWPVPLFARIEAGADQYKEPARKKAYFLIFKAAIAAAAATDWPRKRKPSDTRLYCINVRMPTPPSAGTLLARMLPVRPSSLVHDNIRTRVTQRVRPPSSVRQEERLLRASDKVYARERTRHNGRRLVTAARRGAEHRTVDMWMAKPKSEGQLPARRDAKHRSPFTGKRHAKPRLRPSSNILDEELLVCREPFRLKARRVLVEPLHLIAQPMDAYDHCGRYAGLLDQPAPLRDSLTVTGKDDCFGRIRWHVHRDPPSTVVLEGLGDELFQDCAGGLGGRFVGLPKLAIDLIACLLPHRPALIDRTIVATCCSSVCRNLNAKKTPGTRVK